MIINTVEMTGAVDGAGTLSTFYFSSAAALMTRPDETPASTPFEPRMNNGGSYERHMFGRGQTAGASSRSFGLIQLNGSDRALDPMADIGFDGQPVIIRRGVDGARYPDDVATVFTGTMNRVEVNWQTADIHLTDRQGLVDDLPYQLTRFAGTNSGPVGVEGTANDLIGAVKPKLRGAAMNFAPPQVNSSTLIYQVDDGTAKLPMTIIDPTDATKATVYDKGAQLLKGVQRTTLANLVANVPATDSVDWYAGPDGWYFRLGSTPKGTVTATAAEGALADRTVAQLVARIITQEGGIPLADIDGIAALDAAAPYEAGIWVADDTTVGQVKDALLASVNAYLVDSRTGRMKLGLLVDPAGLMTAGTIEAWQIKGGAQGIKVYDSNDPGIGRRLTQDVNGKRGRFSADADTTTGLPPWRINLDYQKNNTVQTEADVAGIAQSRLWWLKQEFRTAVSSDPSVLLKHKKAPEFTAQTLLLGVNDNGPALESARQLALRKVKRRVFEIPLDPDDAVAFDLGARLDLMLNAFGCEAGKPLLVIGLIEDFGTPTTAALSTLICWG